MIKGSGKLCVRCFGWVFSSNHAVTKKKKKRNLEIICRLFVATLPLLPDVVLIKGNKNMKVRERLTALLIGDVNK